MERYRKEHVILSYTAASPEESTGRFAVSEECVGYEVLDPWYRRIGSLEELLVNEGGEPEYLRVRIGLLGLKSFLIPARTVEVDAAREILLLLR